MSYPIDTFNFTHNGTEYVARVYSDDMHGAPWEEEDGHINVESFRTHEEKPRGYAIIESDRHEFWAYDKGAAIVQAARDGWGLSPDSREYKAIRLKPGKTKPTRRQITYAAVLADEARMRAYLRGDWSYIGVSVSPVDSEETYRYALWGIESDCGDYLQEVARELAAECEAN